MGRNLVANVYVPNLSASALSVRTTRPALASDSAAQGLMRELRRDTRELGKPVTSGGVLRLPRRRETMTMMMRMAAHLGGQIMTDNGCGHRYVGDQRWDIDDKNGQTGGYI